MRDAQDQKFAVCSRESRIVFVHLSECHSHVLVELSPSVLAIDIIKDQGNILLSSFGSKLGLKKTRISRVSCQQLLKRGKSSTLVSQSVHSSQLLAIFDNIE